MKDKPVLEKKNLDKGLKRSVGKPACCVSKGGGSSNTASLPDQLARDKGFEKRAQLYAAKAYSRQADKGGKYIDLKKVFFIAISNCNLFPDKPDYISSHTIRDEKTNEHDLKDFQFIFIELPKFPKNREEQLENVVDRWLFFFKYAEETTDEDLRKIAEKSPIIKLAYDELDKFHWNEKDLVAYEERVMDLQKEAAILEQKLDDAKHEGIQIGEEKGRKEGIQIGHEKGRQEGKAEGEKQAKIAVAKKLLKAGVSIDVIAQITGLSHSEILQLKEKT
ncbi:Rpn family recombination-promoting nuclease/putative transposase [Wolbachia endosymbiont (group A) of Endotricha flammealis]|uniref:Rpn family recombination-promoting nuclease/putative transposase n=1 Tax=Wolbachia endosymbiont (group A) of Endotricha flammealis TaxID=2954004 RepID=UPI00222FA0F3|nr:Rpn family recombination-promoting nuclease/putative transposase [Wolbachia endosymbiont (group A) of Endotricha flammealis]